MAGRGRREILRHCSSAPRGQRTAHKVHVARRGAGAQRAHA
jgi:hypothetical protein